MAKKPASDPGPVTEPVAGEAASSSGAATETAAVLNDSPQTGATPAAPVANADGGQVTPEARLATVASRIEHDGEIYAEDDLILVTEKEFGSLAGGALKERTWDECERDD